MRAICRALRGGGGGGWSVGLGGGGGGGGGGGRGIGVGGRRGWTNGLGSLGGRVGDFFRPVLRLMSEVRSFRRCGHVVKPLLVGFTGLTTELSMRCEP